MESVEKSDTEKLQWFNMEKSVGTGRQTQWITLYFPSATEKNHL